MSEEPNNLPPPEEQAAQAPPPAEAAAAEKPPAEKPPKGEKKPKADKGAKGEKGAGGEKQPKGEKPAKGEKGGKGEKPAKGEKAAKGGKGRRDPQADSHSTPPGALPKGDPAVAGRAARPHQPAVAAAAAKDRHEHGRGQGDRGEEAPRRGGRGDEDDRRAKAGDHVSRLSIAGFKLREGQAIGCKVTLRGKRMWEFLDRLVSHRSAAGPRFPRPESGRLRRAGELHPRADRAIGLSRAEPGQVHADPGDERDLGHHDGEEQRGAGVVAEVGDAVAGGVNAWHVSSDKYDQAQMTETSSPAFFFYFGFFRISIFGFRTCDPCGWGVDWELSIWQANRRSRRRSGSRSFPPGLYGGAGFAAGRGPCTGSSEFAASAFAIWPTRE